MRVTKLSVMALFFLLGLMSLNAQNQPLLLTEAKILFVCDSIADDFITTCDSLAAAHNVTNTRFKRSKGGVTVHLGGRIRSGEIEGKYYGIQYLNQFLNQEYLLIPLRKLGSTPCPETLPHENDGNASDEALEQALMTLLLLADENARLREKIANHECPILEPIASTPTPLEVKVEVDLSNSGSNCCCCETKAPRQRRERRNKNLHFEIGGSRLEDGAGFATLGLRKFNDIESWSGRIGFGARGIGTNDYDLLFSVGGDGTVEIFDFNIGREEMNIYLQAYGLVVSGLNVKRVDYTHTVEHQSNTTITNPDGSQTIVEESESVSQPLWRYDKQARPVDAYLSGGLGFGLNDDFAIIGTGGAKFTKGDDEKTQIIPSFGAELNIWGSTRIRWTTFTDNAHQVSAFFTF